MQEYNVCLTFDINYSNYANVLVSSISNNLSDNCRCNIMILTGCPELLTRSREILYQYDNIRYNMFDVSEYLAKFRPVGRFPPQVYARFFIHNFLSGRVLYLDVDILVNCCISRLFEQESKSGFLASIDRGHSLYSVVRGKKISKYFNAGVFVCDLDNEDIRKRFEIAVSLAEKIDFPLADQDALNSAISEKFDVLNDDFNNTDIFSLRSPSIIHYAHVKPTKKLIYYPAFKKYFQYTKSLNIEFQSKEYSIFDIVKKFVFIHLSRLF